MAEQGRSGSVEWAVRGRPHPEEQDVSGDQFVVVDGTGTVLLAVFDGVGHGPAAARAADVATDVVRRDPVAPLRDVLWRMHRNLAHTRGVAVTLGRLALDTRSLEWIGVGNVSGFLLRVGIGGLKVAAAAPTVGGIVGFQLNRLPAPDRVDVRPGDLLTFTTDGVRPGFEIGMAIGLPVASVADQIIERCAVTDDDSLVLVARDRGPVQ
ncbi:MAG: SpoIIE family protein phosphatase [Acidimicrobiaceae bacterium]|nr:SpoIIE family protein phosphatase [Acidimicrobiaceae bacterium]